jgi:hypothetical protein
VIARAVRVGQPRHDDLAEVLILPRPPAGNLHVHALELEQVGCHGSRPRPCLGFRIWCSVRRRSRRDISQADTRSRVDPPHSLPNPYGTPVARQTPRPVCWAEGGRMSVFAGPVLSKDDPLHGYENGSEIQVPMEFWKVVVCKPKPRAPGWRVSSSGEGSRVSGRLPRVVRRGGPLRSTTAELICVKGHKVPDAHRRPAGYPLHAVRHAVIPIRPVQLGHRHQMPGQVIRQSHLLQLPFPILGGDVRVRDLTVQRVGVLPGDPRSCPATAGR